MRRYKVTRSGQPESRSFCPYGVKGASPSQYIHMFTNQEAPQSLGILSSFIISAPQYISMIDLNPLPSPEVRQLKVPVEPILWKVFLVTGLYPEATQGPGLESTH